jgi:hypothetical protein
VHVFRYRAATPLTAHHGPLTAGAAPSMLLGLDAIVWANVYNDLHWSFARLAMMPPMHPAA